MPFWEDLRQQIDAQSGITVEQVRVARKRFLEGDLQEPPTIREEIFRMRVFAAIKHSLPDRCPGHPPCDNQICAAWRGTEETP